jgi:hypothetical protein
MWGFVVRAVSETAGTWLQGRNAVSKAKAEAEAKVLTTRAESVADWDRIQATNSATSWKDEYLTLLFSIPLIMAFIPGMEIYVQAGFIVLDSMPEWYTYAISVIVAASFGVNRAIGFMKAKKSMKGD